MRNKQRGNESERPTGGRRRPEIPLVDQVKLSTLCLYRLLLKPDFSMQSEFTKDFTACYLFVCLLVVTALLAARPSCGFPPFSYPAFPNLTNYVQLAFYRYFDLSSWRIFVCLTGVTAAYLHTSRLAPTATLHISLWSLLRFRRRENY